MWMTRTSSVSTWPRYASLPRWEKNAVALLNVAARPRSSAVASALI